LFTILPQLFNNGLLILAVKLSLRRVKFYQDSIHSPMSIFNTVKSWNVRVRKLYLVCTERDMSVTRECALEGLLQVICRFRIHLRIIQNLTTMMPYKLLQEHRIDCIVTTGGTLTNNMYLQQCVVECYGGISLRCSNECDAADGAAIFFN